MEEGALTLLLYLSIRFQHLSILVFLSLKRRDLDKTSTHSNEDRGHLGRQYYNLEDLAKSR